VKKMISAVLSLNEKGSSGDAYYDLSKTKFDRTQKFHFPALNPWSPVRQFVKSSTELPSGFAFTYDGGMQISAAGTRYTFDASSLSPLGQTQTIPGFPPIFTPTNHWFPVALVRPDTLLVNLGGLSGNSEAGRSDRVYLATLDLAALQSASKGESRLSLSDFKPVQFPVHDANLEFFQFLPLSNGKLLIGRKKEESYLCSFNKETNGLSIENEFKTVIVTERGLKPSVSNRFDWIELKGGQLFSADYQSVLDLQTRQFTPLKTDIVKGYSRPSCALSQGGVAMASEFNGEKESFQSVSIMDGSFSLKRTINVKSDILDIIELPHNHLGVMTPKGIQIYAIDSGLHVKSIKFTNDKIRSASYDSPNMHLLSDGSIVAASLSKFHVIEPKK
jgi:hypothetical protein